MFVHALYTVTLLAAAAAAEPAKPAAPASETAHDAMHIMVKPADIKWTASPPGLPVGAQVSAIQGDPSKEGPFVMRVMLPANYRVAPHWHPADEHVTVIAGSLGMGMGPSGDAAKGSVLPAGGFAVMPAKAVHYAFTTEETMIQIHGMGPWGITYVNPTDDPRNTPAAAKPAETKK